MWREVPVKRDDLSRIGRLMLEGAAIDEVAHQAVPKRFSSACDRGA